MSKGAGFEINDWILGGALVFVGYSVYETVIKPIISTENQIGSGVTGIESWFSNLFKGLTGGNSSSLTSNQDPYAKDSGTSFLSTSPNIKPQYQTGNTSTNSNLPTSNMNNPTPSADTYLNNNLNLEVMPTIVNTLTPFQQLQQKDPNYTADAQNYLVGGLGMAGSDVWHLTTDQLAGLYNETQGWSETQAMNYFYPKTQTNYS